jgi:Fic family protein
VNPHLIDAQYRSFPAFGDWAKFHVDLSRWERYTAMLRLRGDVSPQQLEAARDVVRRAAAVDTGAIEGLYEVDRGFTYTVATQAAIWEAEVDAKGPRTRALIESQLRAYDYVLDIATQAQPVSEAWIRTLHAEICRPQETYSVATEVGLQVHKLPLGEYKHLPNHVRKADGTLHAYAPVDLVPAEMHRLCEVLRSDEFLAAHPVLQASYAHYAFVVIHPFADGNGRVARALASVFTYRAQSVPLLILADQRRDYFHALEAADSGSGQAFVDFIAERAFDSVLLANESLEAALSPDLSSAVAELSALYATKGGYTQEQVDAAGVSLLDAFMEAADSLRPGLAAGGRLRVSITREFTTTPSPALPGLRVPRGPGGANVPPLVLQAAAVAPIAAEVTLTLIPAVPVDAGREDDVSIVDRATQSRLFSARLSELIPTLSAALSIRLRIAVQRVFARMINDVSTRVAGQARNGGDGKH